MAVVDALIVAIGGLFEASAIKHDAILMVFSLLAGATVLANKTVSQMPVRQPVMARKRR